MRTPDEAAKPSLGYPGLAFARDRELDWGDQLAKGRDCIVGNAGGVAIEAIGLRKKFPKVEALEGVTFSAEKGEALCIIGPNGAGKTTLLFLLGGILYPTAGHVKIFGKDRWLENFEIRKRTTFVTAEPIYGASPTPYEYLRFLGQIYGLPKQEFVERLKRLAGQMNMQPHLHKPWGELSLGMTKKAMLIGGFLPDADLRFMDEPFAGGIDPIAMEALYEWIRAARDRGETILFSTQVLEQAESASDRIALLNGGRISHIGKPRELMEAAGIDPDSPRALGRAFMKLAGGGEGGA